MRPRHPLGSLTVAAAAAALLLLAPWSPSQAANPHGGGGKPSASATAQASATVSGSTATLSAQVSRPAGDVSGVSCVVSGPATYTPTCRLVTSSRKGASYAASLSGLAAGSYTFTARFTLTNGTTAQASATFGVGSGSVPTSAQSACLAYDGTFTTDANGWDCDARAEAYSALSQACTGVAVWTYYTRDKVSRISFSCSGVRT